MTQRSLILTVVLACVLVAFAVAGTLGLFAEPDAPADEQRARVVAP